MKEEGDEGGGRTDGVGVMLCCVCVCVCVCACVNTLAMRSGCRCVLAWAVNG